MHDFRMTTTYHNGRNLIFDVVVPNDCRLTEREIRRRIQAGAKALCGISYRGADRSFVLLISGTYKGIPSVFI